MHGGLQRELGQFRRNRQADRIEAFHVASAAPVKPRALLAQHKRICGPGLPLHRHHIRMPREHHATIPHRADGGIERHLVARYIGRKHERNGVARQILRHESHEIEVGLVADRIEGDKSLQQFNGCQLHWGFAHNTVSVENAPLSRDIQREGRDSDLETFTILADHGVAAHHEASWRVQRTARCVAKAFAHADDGLLAHNAGTFHLMARTTAIGDDPMAALELHGLAALVLDLDRIGPEELAFRRLGAIRQILWLDGDGNSVGDSVIHRIGILVPIDNA